MEQQRESNKEIYIQSLSQYIDELKTKIQKLRNGNSIWFRGLSSDEFKLIPNLYREAVFTDTEHRPDLDTFKTIYRIEQNIDANFSQKSSIFFASKKIQNTPWNRYFLKQHYGIKTRLLDWTENALTALFFALSDSNEKTKDKHARIWLLSPHKLNHYTVNKLLPEEKKFHFYKILPCGKLSKKKELFNRKDEFRYTEVLRKYYRIDCTDMKEMYPLAIYPEHLDERMSAQQACFTIFGNEVNGLNNNDSKERFLDYIYIDANKKLDILQELNRIGISYYSVFPDLEGLGKTINHLHNSEFDNTKMWDTLYHHADNYKP